eukprot:scaffold37075_cov78-Phaeocystis_antarctica.AAC.4
MAKLTRSRRPAADSRAARNTPLTAVELAAPEGVLRAAAVADREGEAAALRPPALGSASAPRRSRRQPARPRSSRVGSRAMAMAVTKAIDAGELGQPPRKRVEAHTAVARQSTPVPSPGVNPRTVLLVALIVVRLALVPVGKAGSVTRHAAAPTLGGAEPRLVLVEAEPQVIRQSELCRHEVILLRRADAGRCAPVLPAQIHAAEERGGALGRHEEAGGGGVRGGPAGRADSRRGGWEEEDSGGHQHPSTDAHPSIDGAADRCQARLCQAKQTAAVCCLLQKCRRPSSRCWPDRDRTAHTRAWTELAARTQRAPTASICTP